MAYHVTQENLHLLEPLFRPWEEPVRHRLPDPKGGPSTIKAGRRRSECPLVPQLRAQVGTWRRGGYEGASDTTKHLLRHWFHGDHTVGDGGADQGAFRYYWCQREAVETAIYLYEVQGHRSQAELLFDYGDERSQRLALGIPAEDDRWLRACFKIATGAGKTKVMTLAIVWSYFHSIYEADSELPRHFVVIAPNLTVFERLKEDLENCRIFSRDPLIPVEWRSDFQMEVVLQDAPGGSSSTGAIYLTNIHRLYPQRENGDEDEGPEDLILGPRVTRAQALETGRELRDRITSHPRIMVLNDEAHHVHDPDMAWSRAIDALHSQSMSRGNAGICMQLDFSATPKHNDGRFFQHIVCDFPLGEAVDAGIVKVPLLGESERLRVHGDKRTPAPERYALHLQIGYEAYAKRYEELEKTRKPVLFVMTEDTRAADEVAAYLDSDRFPLLRGRIMNLHTNLRGRIRTVNRGGRRVKEFVENDSAMKDDDLRALRELSRSLDSPDSPYRCVVSVLMLREGWDVRNVTTIVPLRPYSAASGILPEQTLGRGLRRMFPFQDIPEYVTVVEHPAFRKLYEQELLQEGLDIGTMDVDKPVRQTVTIFVDHERKDVKALDLLLPAISDSVETRAVLEGLTFEEVRAYFDERFTPLPIGEPARKRIEYRERHLFTEEVVRTMELDLGLLSKGWSAASYYAQQVGRACRLTNPHAVLEPLIRRFLAEVLFERPVDLYSGEVDQRLADADVAEHVRATFAPLIRAKTVITKERRRSATGTPISTWNPYQATATEQRPVVPGQRTMFNLVACDNDFEQAFADFLDHATDVAAYAKNAGPQKLMLDYLKADGNRGLYVPDFVVRLHDGTHGLCELKGRVDESVPLKARAAVSWCDTATAAGVTWRYLYVPYHLFQQSAPQSVVELARACDPSLRALLDEADGVQLALPWEEATVATEADALFAQVLRKAEIEALAESLEPIVRNAVEHLDWLVRAHRGDYEAAFQPLLRPLETLAGGLLAERLGKRVPTEHQKLHDYFQPYLGNVESRLRGHLERNQRYLRENLVDGRSMNRVGLLLFCLRFAQEDGGDIPGVWADVRQAFQDQACGRLYRELDGVYSYRNAYVAHAEEHLTDPDMAWEALGDWMRCLDLMTGLLGERTP